MVDILVRPPEIRRTADGLRSCAKKIEQSIQSIDHELSSLKGEKFLGIRSDALQRNYASKRDSLINSKNLVLRFSTDLDNAALAFETADRASSAQTASPLSSVAYVASVPPRTYALLSQLAYSDSPKLSDELKSQGWEVLATSEDVHKTQDGYFGVAFINSRTGEVVIAHRGTNSVNDWDDDYQLVKGNIPDQYRVSREFVDEVKRLLAADARFPDYSLVHTGHSLGAALADLNALKDHSKGIAFDNPGTLQIIRNHQDEFSPELRTNLISYQSNPNLVHLGGENAGYVVDFIPKEGGPIPLAAYLNREIFIASVIHQTLTHHSLDNIVNSLSPETGYPIGYFPAGTGEGNHGYHNLDDYNNGDVNGTANACYLPPELPKL